MSLMNHIIILGSGRLAFQVGKKLRDKGYSLSTITSEQLNEIEKNNLQQSTLESFRALLQDAGLDNAKAIYVLCDEDQHNIQFSLLTIAINEKIPVITSLFNENIISHLQETHKNLFIRNPALIASPVFIDALHTPVLKPIYSAPKITSLIKHSWHSFISSNLWFFGSIFSFLTLIIVSTVFFHSSENISWIDAVYFTTTIITTTGFGDINLHHSSPVAKIFGIFLMLTAIVTVSIVFSLITDRLLKRRSEISLGKRRYKFKNHIIICGLGKFGYQIAKELLRQGKNVLVIEEEANNHFIDLIRARGAHVFVSDASLANNLRNAGVRNASGLFSVIKNDLKNLEIALNARSLKPYLQVIIRIFDKDIADEMRKRLNINFALSTSVIVADELISLLERIIKG